jgi:peptidoglycan/xylan/chitin deacetylase (PgdA/CDA1 family)
MIQAGVANLWSLNTPDRFWACQPNPIEDIWAEAIRQSLSEIGLDQTPLNLDELLLMSLGEAQLGLNRWDLSIPRRIYYELKPFIPRGAIDILKRMNARKPANDFPLRWPVEDRYARFLWHVFDNVTSLSDHRGLSYKPFWPEAKDYAIVLTHDVETERGQSFIPRLAELEEGFGFRSSFNFVPERYKLDRKLIEELCERGFEIGVHGLKHDGKLFRSYGEFKKRADRINHYLRELGAVGFRAPLMHRNPEWMQELRIEYDLSFFDTDPYEPIPGGCMSIWPYFIGHFVELPYTLVQDCTLSRALAGEARIHPEIPWHGLVKLSSGLSKPSGDLGHLR